MKRVFRLVAGVVSFLFIVPFSSDFVFGQTPPPKTSELLSRGKKIYEERCTFCHGVRGNGQTPMDKILNPPARDFTQPLKSWAVSKGDPAKIFRVIKEGIPNSAMLNFSLPDEDVWALVHTVMEFSKER